MWDRKTWFDVFIVALGALLGTLTALEIQSRFILGAYFWIFGTFFGGLFAYLAGDFKEVRIGVARAYREAIGWKWHPDMPYWKSLFAQEMGLGTIAGSLALYIFYASSMARVAGKVPTFTHGILSIFCTVATGATFFVAILMGLLPFIMGDKELQKYGRTGWILVATCNPVCLPFTILFFFGKYSWKYRLQIAGVAWYFAHKTGIFAKRILLYIHPERRKIRFISATLGATMGFFFGSAIIGAVVGAALYIALFEIVAIKWLNLVPSGAK